MPEKQIQGHLFQRIKELLPSGQSLVETISEMLHLSQDSAYRRIRGETGLVMEEAQVLCQHFSLSLDQLFQLKNNSVVFQNTEVDPATYDFTNYLRGILHLLKQLNCFREKSIIYLTKDVPLFHLFAFRPLFTFRYYFWMRTTFEDPALLQQKFSFCLLNAEMEAIGKEILSVYNTIPSIEVWNTESIHSTLQQIDYCRDAGLMTHDEAFTILDSLQELLEHLQHQAEYGRKFLPKESPACKKDNLQLFYNRLGLSDNLILTTHDGRKTIYLNYDALDYMTCMDEAFCNKIYQRLQTTLRRSTLISSVSERERSAFFNTLRNRITSHKQNPLGIL